MVHERPWHTHCFGPQGGKLWEQNQLMWINLLLMGLTTHEGEKGFTFLRLHL